MELKGQKRTKKDIIMATDAIPQLPSTSEEVEHLSEIKKNVEKWYSYFQDNINEAKEHRRFLRGEQWEENILTEYKNLGKVTLTYNVLGSYQRRLSAEVRASTPSVKAIPLERNPQQEQNAKIVDSVLRKIFLSSGAKRSFQVGFDKASGGGFGAIGYRNKYIDSTSFKQEVEIYSIPEPEMCGWDPKAVEKTKCDGDFSFMQKIMTKKAFKKEYGFEPPASTDNYINIRDNFAWYDRDNVVVVDYYEKEYFYTNIVEMASGDTVKKSVYKKMQQHLEENPGMLEPEMIEKMQIVNERKAKDHKIINYVFMSDRILEEKEWGGHELQHIFVDGNSDMDDGKQIIQSFIKDAIDPQKFHNYVKTETVQNIKDSTKEDYIGTRANIKGNEKQWKDKRRRKGILLANPDPITKQMPIKQPPSQINPQLLSLGQTDEEDIKAALGVFDSNLGATSTDLSGKAENIRITQGNLSSFVFIDNLNEAIAQVGTGVVSLFQGITQSTSTVEGLKEDGSTQSTQVNVPQFGGGVQNNIAEGRFKVSIQSSSSFAAQRDAEYERIIQYVQAFPAMQPIVPDIAAKKLNSDISPEIAKRAEMTLPPQIQAQNEDNPQLAQQAQKQMQQQQQQTQQMQQLQEMLIKQKAQDEHIQAMSDQVTSMANMLNAQTNRDKAQMTGVIESAKIKAEEDRTVMEANKEAFKILQGQTQGKE